VDGRRPAGATAAAAPPETVSCGAAPPVPARARTFNREAQMAEIKLEHKRTNPMVWIVPLLLVALAAWWMFGRNDRADDTRTAPPTSSRQPAAALAHHDAPATHSIAPAA
jgi:hypothetical protein